MEENPPYPHNKHIPELLNFRWWASTVEGGQIADGILPASSILLVPLLLPQLLFQRTHPNEW